MITCGGRGVRSGFVSANLSRIGWFPDFGDMKASFGWLFNDGFAHTVATRSVRNIFSQSTSSSGKLNGGESSLSWVGWMSNSISGVGSVRRIEINLHRMEAVVLSSTRGSDREPA